MLCHRSLNKKSHKILAWCLLSISIHWCTCIYPGHVWCFFCHDHRPIPCPSLQLTRMLGLRFWGREHRPFIWGQIFNEPVQFPSFLHRITLVAGPWSQQCKYLKHIFINLDIIQSLCQVLCSRLTNRLVYVNSNYSYSSPTDCLAVDKPGT